MGESHLDEFKAQLQYFVCFYQEIFTTFDAILKFSTAQSISPKNLVINHVFLLYICSTFFLFILILKRLEAKEMQFKHDSLMVLFFLSMLSCGRTLTAVNSADISAVKRQLKS